MRAKDVSHFVMRLALRKYNSSSSKKLHTLSASFASAERLLTFDMSSKMRRLSLTAFICA
jgi:hypothetical protein